MIEAKTQLYYYSNLLPIDRYATSYVNAKNITGNIEEI